MKISNVPQQLIPLAIIFAVMITSLLIVRAFLVPESFGEYGHYRADAVDEIMSQDITYAGYEACYDCHDEQYELKQNSHHANVSCEVCHGAAAAHINEPDEFTPSAPRERGYCPLCHGYDPARPSGFPQIITVLHNPGQACISCHDPHNPQLPHPPSSCSACHREIASRKMVSHHALLPCEKCHSVENEHLVDPRSSNPTRPESRKFCGQCHSKDADSSREIPRINMQEHEPRYLCWDCHYPHQPRAEL